MSRELVESEVFVLLAERRRRLLLRILQESTEPLTAIELATRIGEREYGDPSDEDLRTIYLTLDHNHLPRLEEAAVVVYDSDVGSIHPDRNFDVLIHALEGVSDGDRPWSGT